jgi:hypothetical protein
MTLSGRRPTGRAKSFGNALLDGLSALGTVAHDGPMKERINAIDSQLEELRRERDYLIANLYEPGDLEVSEDYDRFWTPKGDSSETPRIVRAGEGRLTQCKGRDTMGTYHDAHPGCPYIDQRHNAHEFTLRD